MKLVTPLIPFSGRRVSYPATVTRLLDSSVKDPDSVHRSKWIPSTLAVI